MAILNNSIPNANPDVKELRTRSTIPYSYINLGTYRFGEYSPHFVMEAVNGDKIPLLSSHDLRTLSLKGPLMNGVNIHKNYFQIPMEAILPFNWSLIYDNPAIGDDINVQNANCLLDLSKIKAFEEAVIDEIQFLLDFEEETEEATKIANFNKANTLYLKLLVFNERFFSTGSLLSTLGCKLAGLTANDEDSDQNTITDFDSYFDSEIGIIRTYLDSHDIPVTFGNTSFTITSKLLSSPSSGYMNLRQFIEKIRDDNNWKFNMTSVGFKLVDYDKHYAPWSENQNIENFLTKINISRPIAYQLACAEFFTNDKVDYVYSAELYRKNIFSLLSNIAVDTETNLNDYINFTYNGLQLPYDYLSCAILSTILELSISDYTTFNYGFDLIRLLLGFNRSLRFSDYFTGAKTRPLAVGDVNIDVNNSKVNVIDVTRNIQRQKFFNWVNRTGRKFEEYVSSLGGTYVKPDMHNPLFLGHTSDGVGSYQVENTGSAQLTNAQSITSILRSNASKFEFDISVDRPSIILGITSFDIVRTYRWNIERFYYHFDRFDMFNPFLQFIGDQPILRQELSSCINAAADMNEPFGYTMRHQEYKTRVNQCFGGFAHEASLPGFAFIADQSVNVGLVHNVSPDYIRSRNSEFDDFYVSLVGDSLGTYFHFIIANNNYCEPSRPMAYTPTIL